MKNFILAACFLVLTPKVMASSAKVVPASELSKASLAAFLFSNFEQDSIIEFRQGDQLQVFVKLNGDIFTTASQTETIVQVEKSFFLKKDGDEILMSWDGIDFRPFKELVYGQASIGTSGPTPGLPEQILLGAEINIR